MNNYEEKTINGRKIIVGMFPGRLGLKLLTKTAKLLGPRIAEILAGVDTSKNDSVLDASIDMGQVSLALKELLDKIDIDEHYQFILQLLSTTKIDGDEVNSDAAFDLLFMGKLPDLFKILYFVYTVNFKGFLPEGGLDGFLDLFKKQ